MRVTQWAWPAVQRTAAVRQHHGKHHGKRRDATHAFRAARPKAARSGSGRALGARRAPPGLLGVLERTGGSAPLTDSAAARNPHRHGWRPGWSTDRQRPEDARTPAGRVAPAATASRGHLQRDDKLVQSKIHTRIPVSPLPCSPKRRRPTRAGGGTPGSRRQRCPPAGVLLPVSSCRSG